MYSWLKKGMSIDIEVIKRGVVFQASVVRVHHLGQRLTVFLQNQSPDFEGINRGTAVIVRRLDDKGRYEALSEVVERQGSFIELRLVFEWKAQNRSENRVRVNIVAEYALGSSARGFRPVNICDISSSGACLDGVSHLMVGDVIVLRIPTVEGVVEVLARVVWYDERGDTGYLRPRAGVFFVGVEDKEKAMISRILRSIKRPAKGAWPG